MHASPTGSPDENTLSARLAALEERQRRMNGFLGKLAHEAGNLFLPLQMTLDVLDQGKQTVSPQIRLLLQDLADAMSQFTNDLRVISRVARGTFAVRKDVVDLVEFVRHIGAKYSPTAASQQRELRVTLPEEPIRTECDPEALELAIGEILQNAIDFSERQGRIELSLMRGEDEACIRVRDGGPGIAADLLPRVFEMFVQGDPLNPGWGAGLAIARTVAELHGGRIEVRNCADPCGAEFTLRLPMS